MLSIKPLGKAADAAHYYTSKDNYYLSDKESLQDASRWMGRGAEKLSLEGVVEKEKFLSLLEGYLPNGETLGIIKNGERAHRAGTDVTFSAPKSVSILALVGNDSRIANAHMKAVDVAFKRIEAMAAEARITFNEETGYQKTNNLTAASFVHTSSRALDPDLHTHMVILNMTERLDGMWRALSSRAKGDTEHLHNGFNEILFQNQHYFGLVYMSTLAKEIKALGFDIRIKDAYGNFEIEGVSDELIKHLSKRREQILDDMDKNGTLSAKAAEVSNKNTRQMKANIDSQQLMEKWRDDIKGFDVDIEQIIEASKLRKNIGKEGVTTTTDALKISECAKEAVADALEHLSEFNTQIRHSSLVRTAFSFAMGCIAHEEIEQDITEKLKNGELSGKSEEYYTTDKLIQREKDFVNSVTKIKSASFSIKDGHSGLANTLLGHKDSLQIVDVNGLSNQKDLLNELVNIAEDGGIKTYVLHQAKHNTQELSEHVQRDNQGRFFLWLKNLFKDEVVHTVSGFRRQHGNTINPFNRQSLVVVHDAQKLSLDDIESLKKTVDSNKGKLLLLNNSHGIQGFCAGNPIQTLKESGIRSTKAFSNRKDTQVDIVMSRTEHKTAARTQAKNIADNKNTCLVALNNKQHSELSAAIRSELKEQGVLSIQEKEVRVLSNQGLTDTQKKHSKNYDIGDRITFKAFTKEQKHYEVVAVKERHLVLKNEKGIESNYTPKVEDNFKVSKASMLALSKGEHVQCLRALFHNRTKIEKGRQFEVTSIDKEGVTLKDKEGDTLYLDNKALSTSYLTHAYVKKTHQLNADDKDIIVAAKAHQLNTNTLGELSEKARRIEIHTASKSKAEAFFDKVQIKWTAKEIQEKAPELVYRNLSQTNPVIEKDIKKLVDAIDIDKSRLSKKELSDLAVSFAVAKCAERNAAFKHTELMTHALHYAYGEIDFKDIEPVLRERMKEGELIHCNTYWTTKEALDIEKDILAKNIKHQGVLSPIESNKSRLLELSPTLTQGQKDAIVLFASSKDRFNSVQGLAGVGKTTMMKEAQKIAQENGFKVIGLAPTHPAKDELISNSIASETIQSAMLHDLALDEKTIVIADESSMLDNVSYQRLQDKIIDNNARLFFSGDMTQLQSLQAGKPHEQTVETKTQKTARMEEIVRQNPNPTLKKAAELSSKREIANAFKELDKISPEQWIAREHETQIASYKKSVVEVESIKNEDGTKSHQPIYQALVGDYLSRTKECRDNTIVIVPVHKDRMHIDAMIRVGLQEKGEIEKNELSCTRLIEKQLDSADLTKIQTFEEGDLVRFGKSYHIGKKGEYFQISAVDLEKNHISLTDNEGLCFKLGLKAMNHAKVSLYQEITSPLSTGDRIRLRLTNEDKGFIANTEYRVNTIDKEGIATISNGKDTLTLCLDDKEDQHWDYAYTNTAYSLQGTTSKYAIGLELVENIIAMTHRSHEIINTRPSCHLSIYTNDREGLIQRMEDPIKQKDADKTSAIFEYEKAKFDKFKGQALAENLKAQTQESNIQKKAKTHDSQQGFKSPHANKTTSTNYKTNDTKLDAKAIEVELKARSEELVTHLLGKPNQKLSRPNNYRYGGKGSLSVNLESGLWHSFETGESGNLFHLIAQEKGYTSFKDVLQYSADFCNYKTFDSFTPKNSDATKKMDEKSKNPMLKWAKKYHSESEKVEGTLVEKYLRVHRNIHAFKDADIRYHKGVYTKSEDGSVKYPPALLAFSRNNKGEINHVQITRLHAKTANKDISFDPVKQTFGKNYGHTVNLNIKGEGDTCYYTEGVETGLSIVTANAKARVYTVLGKENFATINVNDIPAKNIVLCVDNDGENTFKFNSSNSNKIIEAVDRLTQKGFNVSLSIPKEKGRDLNDILKRNGEKGVVNELKKPMSIDEYKDRCNKVNGISSPIKSKYTMPKTPSKPKDNYVKKGFDISQVQIIEQIKSEQMSVNKSAVNQIEKSRYIQERTLEKEL